jgi:hypothetical protein
LREREAAVIENLTQRLTAHQFHDNEGTAFFRLSGVMDHGNVWMTESRKGAGFSLEPCAIAIVGVGEKLYGDRAIQTRVACEENGTHAAFTEAFLYFIT